MPDAGAQMVRACSDTKLSRSQLLLAHTAALYSAIEHCALCRLYPRAASLYCARTAPSCVQGSARGDLSHSQQLDMIVVDLRSLRRAKLRCCCTAQAISTSMPSRRAARAASYRQRLCLAIPSTANQVSCPCPRCAEVSVQVRAVSPARQTKNAIRCVCVRPHHTEQPYKQRRMRSAHLQQGGAPPKAPAHRRPLCRRAASVTQQTRHSPAGARLQQVMASQLVACLPARRPRRGALPRPRALAAQGCPCC